MCADSCSAKMNCGNGVNTLHFMLVLALCTNTDPFRMMLDFSFRLVALHLTWCWSSYVAMVFWKVSVSAGRVSPTVSRSTSSVSATSCLFLVLFPRDSWTDARLLRRW